MVSGLVLLKCAASFSSVVHFFNFLHIFLPPVVHQSTSATCSASPLGPRHTWMAQPLHGERCILRSAL